MEKEQQKKHPLQPHNTDGTYRGKSNGKTAVSVFCAFITRECRAYKGRRAFLQAAIKKNGNFPPCASLANFPEAFPTHRLFRLPEIKITTLKTYAHFRPVTRFDSPIFFTIHMEFSTLPNRNFILLYIKVFYLQPLLILIKKIISSVLIQWLITKYYHAFISEVVNFATVRITIRIFFLWKWK